MRRTGAHMSIAGGLHMALERGHAIGCTCIQMFSHNPRGWRSSPIAPEEAELFSRQKRALDISPVFIHTSYLINIASPKEELRVKSLEMLRTEMLRASEIGAEYVVLHTGTAHDGGGMARATESIKEALGDLDTSAGLLIENTSGKRGDISSRMPDLARLMEQGRGIIKGVCIDSCHAYAAGYDLATPEGLEIMANEIREYMGQDAVKLLHLNDSKGELASTTDRHDHIGHGRIGNSGLGRFLNHEIFKNAPAILETPKDSEDDDIRNLAALRNLLR